MDICAKHHDYIRKVRENKLCNDECCSANDKREGNEYCPCFQNGLPEVVVAITPDDITLTNRRINFGQSKYKTLKEYTDQYNITDEQIDLILKRRLRRDTRFYKKIELVEKMMKDKKYDPVRDENAMRTTEAVFFK